MNKKNSIISGLLMLACTSGFLSNTAYSQNAPSDQLEPTKTETPNTMKLGVFSMSLSVKNLSVSKEFYEKLGFSVFGGGMEQNYLIMKNGNALIGLFQGMFEGNILTFNPGWDENAQNVEDFDDIREIQKQLKSGGLTLASEVDENTQGPGSVVLTDPDGNMILLDQHR